MLKRKKSLAKILGTFTKTILQLEELVKHNDIIVSDNNDTIGNLQEENVQVKTESSSANNVLKNIRKLISTED